MPCAPFTYPKLPEGQFIRLLDFKPRDENEPIHLKIIDAALPTDDNRSSEMHVPYVALSYVWGFSDENDPEILLNNNTPFTITPNLSKALAHLENKIDHAIWIDAICIDQKNKEEKGRQIKMMDQIYQHAERTIIWLGEGDSSTEKVMKHLQYIGEMAIDAGLNNLGLKAMMEWPDFEADGNHDNNVEIKTKIEALFPKISRSLQGPFLFQKVFDISELPWFQRVWVIQEGCVAKECEFRCGKCKIPGEAFLAAYLFTSMWIGDEVRRLTGSSLFTLPLKFWSIWWRSGRRLAWAVLGTLRGKTAMVNTRAMVTMGTRRAWKRLDKNYRPTLKQQLCRAFILSSADGLNATMPKDRIYAFLGISRDAQELGIDPTHYTLSTTEALYRDVARKLIQRGNLDILSLCRTTTSGKINSTSITTSVDPRNIALPSWVPDWEAIILPPWGGYKEDGFFHASGPDEIHLTSTKFDNTLILKARYVGTLKRLGTTWSSGWQAKFDLNQAKALLIQLLEFLKESAIAGYACHALYDHPIWRIAIGDKAGNDLGITQRVKDRKKLFGEFNVLWSVVTQKHSWFKIPDMASYSNAMGDMHNSKPFLLDDAFGGYVGLCPHESKIGDEIYIPFGAHVPYVLRKSGDGCFKLVGEAYVHGLMDGEAVDLEMECRDVQLT